MADPIAARDEFAIRYYRWALEDSGREVREGFARLRSIRSAIAIRAVEYLSSLSDSERRRLAAALVKRNHRRALELAGEPISADEAAMIEAFRQAMRNPSAGEEAYRRAVMTAPAQAQVNRGALLAAVTDGVGRALGGAGERFSTAHEWKFTTAIGPWTMITLVDVGGTAHQLAYQQSIRADERRYLQEGISILSWLGIGGGHTTWDRLTDADTASAAASLARVVADFAGAAPALLAGLSP